MVDSEVVTDKNAEVYMIEPVVDSEAVTDRNAEVYVMHQFWASPRGLGELGRRVIYFWGAGKNAKYFRGAGEHCQHINSKHFLRAGEINIIFREQSPTSTF